MIRLRDIMTTDVLTLDPKMSIREAMQVLSEQHVSGAPVVSRNEVVGVVSITDLMEFEGSPPGPVEDAARLGELESDDDTIPAFFSDLSIEAPGQEREIVRRWNALDEYSVAEVMTRSPILWLSPDATAVEGAELMRAHSIHRVLVMDGAKLVGVVTTSDIARAVAEGKLVTRTWVFESGSEGDDRGWRNER